MRPRETANEAADGTDPAVPTSPGSSADAVSRYVADQVERLAAHHLPARTGGAEGVHQMRVAARRLRSVLGTYGDLLPPGTARLRPELRWLGSALGAARDAEVMGERLRSLLEEQPEELVVGPVRRRIEGETAARSRQGHREAVAALTSTRYSRLLARLESLQARLADVPPAGQAARGSLGPLLQADVDRLRRRQRAVGTAAGTSAQDHALHEVRKAAKRLRYAAELAQPVHGEHATHLARVAEALQELLGEHQDSVVARELLRELADLAEAHGESAFTYGRLHALEEARATSVAEQCVALVAGLPQGPLERWLDS